MSVLEWLGALESMKDAPGPLAMPRGPQRSRRPGRRYYKRTEKDCDRDHVASEVPSDGGSSGSKVAVSSARSRCRKRTVKSKLKPEAQPASVFGFDPDSTRAIELFPLEVIMQVLKYLHPPEMVCFLNSSPILRRRVDTQQMWKGCWYWLADEFSGAVTVHRLLGRVHKVEAFDWKLLVLLDHSFQYRDLSYRTIRSMAREWCAKVREISLVLELEGSKEVLGKIDFLIESLKKIHTRFCSSDEVSTEDDYDHDKEWEMVIVSGMALASVRTEVKAIMKLPPKFNFDKLKSYYEALFAPYKDLVGEDEMCSESDCSEASHEKGAEAK
ncbi:hypothetical protein DIPPA_05363 [Diplonema papillatum]|nr:hypothetical protein DIPPA_05363 [Diplonema papillatum]